MKYCRHCGASMQDEAAVCVKCGVAVNVPVKSDSAYCRSCGAEMNGQAVLCTKCGISQDQVKTAGSTSFSSLHKSRDGKLIAGVCSGLGKQFKMDPWVVRLLFILTNLAVGLGTIAYIVLAFILPSED